MLSKHCFAFVDPEFFIRICISDLKNKSTCLVLGCEGPQLVGNSAAPQAEQDHIVFGVMEFDQRVELGC